MTVAITCKPSTLHIENASHSPTSAHKIGSLAVIEALQLTTASHPFHAFLELEKLESLEATCWRRLCRPLIWSQIARSRLLQMQNLQNLRVSEVCVCVCASIVSSVACANGHNPGSPKRTRARLRRTVFGSGTRPSSERISCLQSFFLHQGATWPPHT